MKMNKVFAVLLTALFLTPFFPAQAEEKPAFTAEEHLVLQGMDRSWTQGYTPKISKGRWTMIMPVRSETAVGIIHAEMTGPDESISPFKPQKMTVDAREEQKGVWGVRFDLALFQDRKNGDYPCVIRLNGTDGDGNALETEIPYTLRIRDSKTSMESGRLLLTGLQAELSIGEEGEIRATLTNPSAAADYEQVELKISDATGGILPRDAEALEIGGLKSGESVSFLYPVTVLKKTAVAPHVLKFDFTWTALGQQATRSMSYTCAVRQTIRMEQGGLKMASAVTAGDAVTLTLPLMNMGQGEIVNVMATVSLPGITERQSVLVGNILPGETKQAQLILIPGKDTAGDFTGTLTAECTDNDGNTASFTLPIQLTVEKPVQAAVTAEQKSGARTEEKPLLTWGLGGFCGVLLMALLLQGILLRGKLHRLEEEKL